MRTRSYGHKKQNSRNHYQGKHVLCVLGIKIWVQDFMDARNRVQETIIRVNMHCVYLILTWVQDFIDTKNRIQEIVINVNMYCVYLILI